MVRPSENKKCKGNCKHFENPIVPTRNNNYYANPLNCRCTFCDIYMRYSGAICPCCKNRLRRRPKDAIGAGKILIVKGVKRIG